MINSIKEFQGEENKYLELSKNLIDLLDYAKDKKLSQSDSKYKNFID